MDLGGSAPNAQRAAELMAKVFEEELVITVTPEAILKMFKKRFNSLSDLAHAIHNGQERERESRKRQGGQPIGGLI